MAEIATKVRVGAADSIPPGQGRCFLVGGEEVAVFRQRDGQLFATQNRCPHKNGPLSEGIVGGGKVICPFHSRKFDLCTGVNAEGDKVKVYAVREESGGIIVEHKS